MTGGEKGGGERKSGVCRMEKVGGRDKVRVEENSGPRWRKRRFDQKARMTVTAC